MKPAGLREVQCAREFSGSAVTSSI